ncbi:MAG: hypothetical protein FWD51_01345 [Betaproteobacteria bacterium]|nr:hypothetical protein [Betaproteobacteria bacterium]
MDEFDYTIIGKDASYPTKQGEALIAKLMASKGTLELTNVQVGTGDMPESMIPYEMTGANGYICDAMIEGVTNPCDGQSMIGIQLTSIGLPEGANVTNLAIMARDPELGEICYNYVSLHEHPQWIRPDRESVNTLARFLVYILVSGIPIVEAVINPDVLITYDQMEAYTIKVIWPKAFEDAQYYVDQVHNLDIEAHPWLRKYMKTLEDKLDKIMEMFNGQGSTPFFWDPTITIGWEVEEGVINLAENRVEC